MNVHFTFQKAFACFSDFAVFNPDQRVVYLIGSRVYNRCGNHLGTVFSTPV